MSDAADVESLICRLFDRPRTGHKGDFGRALLIGGSRGMSGAIALAGKATLRSGAGLVTLAVPEACLATVAGFEPSYMTAALPCGSAGRIDRAGRTMLEPLIAAATVVAVGPGLGRGNDIEQLVAWLYASCPKPLVIDADALNALASLDGSQNGSLDGGIPQSSERIAAPRILTPHPGEFARLIGHRIDDRGAQRNAAEQFAAKHNVVVLLKGAGTIITDGRQTALNATGNPGMATGGTGDVLTGVVTGLLCQGLSPFDAARAAAYVHGRAGDLAADTLGQVSLIASDLIERLPAAFLSCRAE